MIAPDRLRGVIGLRVPGDLAYRHLAIRLVSTACKIALESSHDASHDASHADEDGAAQEDADADFEPEVVSAFGEAFNNVAVHGYAGVAPGPLQIEVDWDAHRLVVTMIDEGRTFDPATVAEPDLDALPESGMGWFIMTSCMDEVDYQPGPPNVLRLVKLRADRDGLLPPAPGEGESGGAVEGDRSGFTRDGDEANMGDRGSGISAIGAAAPGRWKQSVPTTR